MQKTNDPKNTPRAIGIIMDGNRRWAKAANVPSLEGHRLGYEKIRSVLGWCRDAGVEELTIYAFSTENWNRDEKEVAYLLDLFRAAFKSWVKDLEKENVRIRFIGERTLLPGDIQVRMQEAENETKEYTNGTLVIALSYGGRAEILSAVNALLVQEREVVTEEEVRAAMWSAGLRDPDLIIRTGGEHRLSNFLLWQSAYSELFFTDTKWPAFSKEEFEKILEEYSSRERRIGT